MKISEFLTRMKIDSRFRTYYNSVYDAIRLLHKRIFDVSSDVIVESERIWRSKLEIALDEERGALDRLEVEIIVRRSRVAWLEQVQADNLGDRYHWRRGLEPLPSWKSKTARHAAKRKAARSSLVSEPKKTKIDVLPQVEDEPVEEESVEGIPVEAGQRTVRLVDYSDDEDVSRRVVFLAQSEQRDLLAEGSGLTPATLELDSAMGVGSQIDPSTEDSAEVAYRQLKELVDEPSPSGSRETNCKPSFKFKVGMRSVGKKGSSLE